MEDSFIKLVQTDFETSAITSANSDICLLDKITLCEEFYVINEQHGLAYISLSLPLLAKICKDKMHFKLSNFFFMGF